MKLRDLGSRTGSDLGTSRWFHVEQGRIDRFADTTEDWQDIHCDPQAARQTPFGGTIAHGFLSLSLLSAMLYDVWNSLGIEDVGTGLNYGFDKVRFLSPLRSGAIARARFHLAAFEEKRPGEYLVHYDVVVEARDSERPVLVARWLGMMIERRDGKDA